MKKQNYWDVPLGMVVLAVSFFSGGLLGFFLASLMISEGETSLANYFMSYFDAVRGGDWQPNLSHCIWSHLKPPLLAFLLGFSFLGTIGVPLLVGIQGFYFTFSVATLCRWMGITGLIPAFFLFCLPALVWVPVLFILGLQSFHVSQLLWRRGRKEDVYPVRYFVRAALCFGSLIFSIAFEYYILPLLMSALI